MKPNDIIKYKGVLGKVVCTYPNQSICFHPINYATYQTNELEIIDSEHVEEPTTEEKISFIEQSCYWGKVVKTHIIGDIQIIEYKDKEDKTLFEVHINFQRTTDTATTLDQAIIIAMCNKHKCNSAGHWIMKILGISNE